MAKRINIPKTFRAMRKLPLAVSFQQVESWVLNQTISQKTNSKPSWLDLIQQWFHKR